MDILQDYVPHLFNLYNTYSDPLATFLTPLYSRLLLCQSLFLRYVYPSLYPLYRLLSTLLQHALTSSGDSSSPASALTSLAILLVLAYVSFKLLDMLRRQVLFWVTLALRMGTWLAVGMLGWYVYNRGMEESVEDVQWVLGVLAGWGKEGQQRGGRLAREKAGEARRVKTQGYTAGKRTRGGGW